MKSPCPPSVEIVCAFLYVKVLKGLLCVWPRSTFGEVSVFVGQDVRSHRNLESRGRK